MDRSTYDIYLDILRRELVCALGCTEPIAVAYVAALARDALGAVPEHLEVSCSGNIIKNVKSVTVPNSGDQRGIEAAATLGAVGGDATRALEVLEGVGEKDRQRTRELVSAGFCSVSLAEGVPNLYVRTVATGQGHTGVACVAGRHTNVVELSRDGVTVSVDGVTANEQDTCGADGEPEEPGLSSLSLEGIWEFAHEVDVEDIREMVERQVELNAAISDEGLSGDWGARIGKTLLLTRPDDISCRARAAAAAGSDARMSGCEMPVIIVSGSGNQGITASVPVVEYAKELNVSRDQMVRAVLLSDLLTIHLKTGIGRLSAYCGAVSAGCSAGAAIAYLHGGGFREIAHTLVNSLAIVSGMICDGAKASCAAKISAAVDAGLVGYSMFRSGQQFRGGDGIVTKGVEETIRNIGRLGRLGMRETDREIIRIMTNQPASEEAD